jgi:hypothetical protein
MGGPEMLADRASYILARCHPQNLRCAEVFLEDEMTKPRKPKAAATLRAPGPEVCRTVEQTPEEVRAILWKIASDPDQSGTARVSACRILLADARERGEGGETRHDADLNKRALALMRRVAN